MTTFNADYEAILAAGESKTVEFKASVPRYDALAKIIGAFANAEGGHLLMGVRESQAEAAEPIDGFDTTRAERAVYRALELLEPKPKVEVSAPIVKGIRILDVIVSSSSGQPVLAAGSLYVRRGERIEPARARDIVNQLSPLRDLEDARVSVERLAGAIEKQTRTIEEQGKVIEESHVIAKRLAAANAWWRKAMWIVLGAIVGALAREFIPVILDML